MTVRWPHELPKRAAILLAAYLLIEAGLASMTPALGDAGMTIAFAFWYAGAAGIFVALMVNISRRFAGRPWHLLGGLIVAAAITGAGMLAALVIMVNLWEGQGLSH